MKIYNKRFVFVIPYIKTIILIKNQKQYNDDFFNIPPLHHLLKFDIVNGADSDITAVKCDKYDGQCQDGVKPIKIETVILIIFFLLVSVDFELVVPFVTRLLRHLNLF